MRALPPGLRYPLAGAAGATWYAAAGARRRSALQNYGAALGLPPSDPYVATVARRAFANYGQMLADFVLIGSLGAHQLRAAVTSDGLEHLDAAVGAGRGCILAAPHMGSWDMAVSYAAAVGYRVAGVTEQFPGSLDGAVVEARSRFGMEVIPLGRSAVPGIRRALADNSIVALLCDLPRGPGVEVSFFGRRARVPGGPANLARKHSAPLMPVCAYRTGPGRYHVHIGAPMEPDMQQVVHRFEAFIRARPDQWYAFMPLFD